MYSGVLTNVPAFEQPATMSWLRYLLVVKGGGGGAPRAGCCAAIPTAATTKSAADARTRFNSFTNLLLSRRHDLRNQRAIDVSEPHIAPVVPICELRVGPCRASARSSHAGRDGARQ